MIMLAILKFYALATDVDYRHWKNIGLWDESKILMPPLNNFSNFFWKNSNFCDFEED